MTTTKTGSLDRAVFGLVVGMDSKPTEVFDDGRAQVTGLEVFKAATFRDSLGEQRTWTPQHLEQMVFNFKLLRDSDAFPHVPVRADHSFSVESVVGYVDQLHTANGRLLADFTFTEPTAFEKFQRTTYRGRSLEVGFYETNDEQFYWPVVLGFAFVDVPAVEGLHSRQMELPRMFSLFSKEASVTTTTTTPTPTEPAPTPPTPPVPTPPEPVPPAHSFRVNGGTSVDFVAVQAHIDGLEKFRKEALDTGRRSFVKGLADAKKITAPQVESLTAVALGLTDDQFEAFKASYESAVPLSLLANHGDGTTNPDGKNEPTDQEREVAKFEAILRNHRLAGMSTEQIEKTDSFRQLQALKTGK